MESLLAECGFRNVFSQADRKWPKVALTGNKSDDELPLPERPELILLPSEPYHFDEADRDSLVELGFLREQITFVDGESLSWWLSRTAPALKQFSELRIAREVIGQRSNYGEPSQYH